MFFWILVALTVLTITVSTIFYTRDVGWEPLMFIGRIFGYAGIALGVWLLTMLGALIYLAIRTETGEFFVDSRVTTEELRALSTEATVEGRAYFLAGGYIEGDRMFSYIVDHGDYSTVETADADYSSIWEDTEIDPYVDETQFFADMSWLFPVYTEWDIWVEHYAFHIPAESVVEGYSVDLNG